MKRSGAAIAIAKLARENPFMHFTHEETRILFGIGEKSFRGLLSQGAPIVAGKLNPEHFQKWLWEHRETISKLD